MIRKQGVGQLPPAIAGAAQAPFLTFSLPLPFPYLSSFFERGPGYDPETLFELKILACGVLERFGGF